MEGRLAFDPTNVIDSIALSNDPILLALSAPSRRQIRCTRSLAHLERGLVQLRRHPAAAVAPVVLVRAIIAAVSASSSTRGVSV
jgi:hypothetical protein